MSDLGINLIEISGGNYENTTIQGSNEKGAFFTKYAAKAKQGLNTPVLVTGGFKSLTGMAHAVENGETELVGLSRGLALMPDLPNRAAKANFTPFNSNDYQLALKQLIKRPVPILA